MSFARALIAEGIVPPPEAFQVSGMLSEHEVGLAKEPCEQALCLDGALAIAPAIDGSPAAWLQIGMSSNLDPDLFVRPSITVVAAVDVSDAMGWETANTEVTPATLARELLLSIAADLGPNDRIAIITYASRVLMPLPLTSGPSQSAVADVLERLSGDGAANADAGLLRAFTIAQGALGQTDETRVLLFTPTEPEAGTGSRFELLASSHAQEGVGLTVVGLGLDLGLSAEFMSTVSRIEGGNAFSLTKLDQVDRLMVEDWAFLARPIATSLNVGVIASAEISVADVYGLYTFNAYSANLQKRSVFFSRRQRPLLLRLAPTDGQLIPFETGTTFDYLLPESNNPGYDNLTSGYRGEPLDDRGHYYEQPAIAKTVALALLTSGMREAAELYNQFSLDGVSVMTAAYTRFEADAAALGDSALDPELELAAALLTLMQTGAPQGELPAQE